MTPGTVQHSPSRFGILIAVLAVAGSTSFSQRTPLQLARTIADRIVRETDLSFRLVPLKPPANLQVVDFMNVFGHEPTSAAYAFSAIVSDCDTMIRFGVGHDCPVRIWVNRATVFEHSVGHTSPFKEVGYERYDLNDTMGVRLRKGENTILLKVVLSGPRNVVYLSELLHPEGVSTGRFDLKSYTSRTGGIPWMFAGVFFSNDDAFAEAFPPEQEFSPGYLIAGRYVTWKLAPIPLVSEFTVPPHGVYTRESYAEWTYSNGTVLLSLLHLSEASGNPMYESFVHRVCDLTLSNLSLLRYQYEALHAHRTADYRIFRRALLDDTGAPVLPYVELLPHWNDDRLRSLVDTMALYVAARQMRLPDGTLCRAEPGPLTVWADDLFMSIPFLVRLGEQSGSSRYFDDAAKQIVNFNRYLVDKKTGLYRHGYYDFKKEQSPAFWGRANGWIVWANSEALLHLPTTHPMYQAVTTVFRRHMKALVAVQGKSGLWHQLLDRPDSFEETSCTAMFMIGLARGIRRGILDESYKPSLEKAWEGLHSRISDDGVVKDICRGTGISDELSFYLSRDRFDNDPRGLGAVIMACIEMSERPEAKPDAR